MRWKSGSWREGESSRPSATPHAGFEHAAYQRESGMVPVSRGRSHVIDGRELRQMFRQSSCAKSVARRDSDQSAFEQCEPARHSRARPDRDTGVGDAACVVRFYHRRYHDNRNHQVTPGSELQKRRCGVIDCAGNNHVGQDLIGTAYRFPISHDEVGQGHAACSHCGDKFYSRIERQQGRHTVSRGGGVTEITAYRTPILYLNSANFAGCALETVEASGQRSGDQLTPGRKAADADVVCFDGDAFDFGEAGYVNNPIMSGSITQRGKEVRAARQNLALIPGQCMKRCVERLGPGIHVGSPPQVAVLYEWSGFVQRDGLTVAPVSRRLSRGHLALGSAGGTPARQPGDGGATKAVGYGGARTARTREN